MNSSHIKSIFSFSVLIILATLNSCNTEEPTREDVPELITEVTLTFTPAGGAPVVVTATDPDGEGIQDIRINGDIVLARNTTYVLSIGLVNGLAAEGSEAHDIAAEVAEEGAEHQLFFSFTDNAFANPAGNGNIDSRADAVNYTGGTNSLDENGRPLGLTTTWTTSASALSSGNFRVLLKHQPDLKTDTSGSTVGETDLDVTFVLKVQ